MARKINIGENVYVLCSRVPGLENKGIALDKTEVLDICGRKVKIKLSNGCKSEWIDSALIHRDVGILILNIGDFNTERNLLDPMAKSVKQFCWLLVPDDQFESVRIRSLEELKVYWQNNQAAYSHVIWIGHGNKTSLNFAVGGWINAETLKEELRVHGAPKKTYVSLCCKTGYQSIGAVMSKAPICENFLAPFHSVEGAVASQFCQTFLTSHILHGKSAGVAFNHASKSVPGRTSFRLWNSGKLKAGPKK